MKCKMVISWGRKERRISLSISQALSYLPLLLNVSLCEHLVFKSRYSVDCRSLVSIIQHATFICILFLGLPKKGGCECPSIGGGVNELKGSRVVQTETVIGQTRWLACFSSVIHTLSPTLHMLVEPVHFELGPNYRAVIVQRTKNMINRRAGYKQT